MLTTAFVLFEVLYWRLSPKAISAMRTTALIALGLSYHIQHVAAQFPPKPEGLTVIKSKFHENVTISFKEVSMAPPQHNAHKLTMPQPGICETTPGVKSYSGYVHLPPGFLDDGSGEVQDYPINT